jgi:hypothetical protein
MNPPILRRLSGAFGRIGALSFILALLSAAPARAQLSVLTANPLLYSNWVQGSANAWDPVHQVYLVVGAPSNTTSPLVGIFTDVAGNSLGAFPINSGGVYSQSPSVVYSPSLPNGSGGTGAFLVAWHENGFMSGGVETAIASPNYVQTRIVSYPAGSVGVQQSLVGSVGSFWLSSPNVQYSSISNIYFLAWRGMDTMLYAARLDGNGRLIGAPFRIVPTSQSWQNPSAAWDSVTDQFAVLSTGYGGPAGATTAVTIVTAAGNVAGTNIFNVAPQTFVTAIDFNPTTGHYVGVWFQNPGGTMGAEIASNGAVLAQGVVSTATGTPDTEGIAFNPISGTFLLAAEGRSWNIWGAELNAHGVRDSADMEITSSGGPKGSFYPSPTSRPDVPQWNVSFSHNFNELRDQIIATSSSSGGSGGSLGAPPPGQNVPPPVSTPPPSSGSSTNCPGYPTPAFPGAVCVNGGWIPGGSTGGSTPPPSTPPPPPPPPPASGGSTTCPGYPNPAFPGAVCVNGGWIPGGSTGGSTPPSSTPPPPPPPPSGGSTTCPGYPNPAFPGAVCVNGGWVPGASGSTSCPGYPNPAFPGAVCVNGGWIPGGSTGGSTPPPSTPPPSTPPPSGSTTCPGYPNPAFPGAVCVNGGWVPATTTSSSTSCPGYPNPAFPGAVCVNGGWVPGGATSTGTTTTDGTCTTPDPFTSIGGGICSKGGWRPKV